MIKTAPGWFPIYSANRTIVFQPMSRALDSKKSGISLSQHHVGRPLLTPDEVRNLRLVDNRKIEEARKLGLSRAKLWLQLY